MKNKIFALLMIFTFSTSMLAIEIRGKRKVPSEGYAQQQNQDNSNLIEDGTNTESFKDKF